MFQFTDGAQNGALDAMKTSIGRAPTMTLRTGGAPPVNAAAVATGVVLAGAVVAGLPGKTDALMTPRPRNRAARRGLHSWQS